MNVSPTKHKQSSESSSKKSSTASTDEKPKEKPGLVSKTSIFFRGVASPARKRKNEPEPSYQETIEKLQQELLQKDKFLAQKEKELKNLKEEMRIKEDFISELQSKYYEQDSLYRNQIAELQSQLEALKNQQAPDSMTQLSPKRTNGSIKTLSVGEISEANDVVTSLDLDHEKMLERKKNSRSSTGKSANANDQHLSEDQLDNPRPLSGELSKLEDSMLQRIEESKRNDRAPKRVDKPRIRTLHEIGTPSKSKNVVRHNEFRRKSYKDSYDPILAANLIQNLTKNIISFGNKIVAEEEPQFERSTKKRVTNISFMPPTHASIPIKKIIPIISEEEEFPDNGGQKTKYEPLILEETFSTRMQKSKGVPKLFEDFFIIGVNKEEVLKFEEENPGVDKGFLSAKILFNHPGTKEDVAKAPRNSVAEFMFPFKVKIKRKRITSNDGLFGIVLAKNTSEHNSNCFVVPLLPGEVNTSICQNSDVVREGNPNSVLYLVCIKTKDYVELPSKEFRVRKDGKKQLQRKIWKVERVCCFMTFYPLIKCFMDLNVHILNMFKIERMAKFAEAMKEQSDVFQEMDANWVQAFTSQKLAPWLDKLLLQVPKSFGKNLPLQLDENEKTDIYIPEIRNAFTMEGEWALPLVFTTIPLSDFMFIFSIVMSERKLVLMSSNLNLLTSTLMALYTLLKPFNYTYPMIFNLPEILLPLLDAPGGLLIGINQGLEYLQSEQLYEVYSECAFVVMEGSRLITFCDPSNKLFIAEPYFGNLKGRVSKLYQAFNPEINRKMEYGPLKKISLPGKKADNSNSATLANSKKKLERRGSAMNQGISAKLPKLYSTEKISCEPIMKLFYAAFVEHIINHLPKDPIYRKDTTERDLDYVTIADIIIEKNPKDKQFLEAFLTTQIFTYYLDTHYKIF